MIDLAYIVLLKYELLGSYCGHTAVFDVPPNSYKTNNHEAVSS